MDDIDRKILKLLQENARTSLKTIAEKTFLSSPAVSSRIERMEREGIILGYEAQVDPIKLGYHILAFINLNVLPEDKPKFYAYANGVPNILECSCVTRRILHADEGGVSKHPGAGYFCGSAADIWKNQYSNCILHSCRSQGSGRRQPVEKDRDSFSQLSDEAGIWCYRSAIWLKESLKWQIGKP